MKQSVLFFLKNKGETKYLYGDMNIDKALDEMKTYKYTALPVIDKEGFYLGTITEGDFLWHLRNNGSMDTKVKQLIRKELCEAVSVDTNISSLFEKSLHQNFVPIVDDRSIFIGIVTRKTIIQYLIRERA